MHFGSDIMAVEFRTGFLGFNKDDVLSYVHKKDFELKNLSNELNAQIEQLKKQLASLNEEHKDALLTVAAISAENDALKARAQEVENKAEELENIGSKIGKLYLMSKATAETIVKSAEENASVAEQQTDAHIKNIESTQETLKEIVAKVLASSEEFVSGLETLNHSLNDAKIRIDENNELAEGVSEEFAELYSKLG